jgi:hypothetical protein
MVLIIVVFSLFLFVRKWHTVSCCKCFIMALHSKAFLNQFSNLKVKGVQAVTLLGNRNAMQFQNIRELKTYIIDVRYWWNLEGPWLSLIVQWYLQSNSLLNLHATDGYAKMKLNLSYCSQLLDDQSLIGLIALNCCTLQSYYFIRAPSSCWNFSPVDSTVAWGVQLASPITLTASVPTAPPC